MKTNTYDLNLYIIDGQVKILAHRLQRNTQGELITGTQFSEALNIQLKRSNRAIWQPIVDFFTGESNSEVFNELDDWHCASIESATQPYSKLPDSYLKCMPPVLATVAQYLPEYEV
jgi:hypothetical protein